MIILTKVPDGSLDVIQILHKEELLTIEEIDKKLPAISRASVRYAVRRLLEAKIIQSIPDLMDMRTVKYRLSSDGKLRQALLQLPPLIYDQLMEGIKE